MSRTFLFFRNGYTQLWWSYIINSCNQATWHTLSSTNSLFFKVIYFVVSKIIQQQSDKHRLSFNLKIMIEMCWTETLYRVRSPNQVHSPCHQKCSVLDELDFSSSSIYKNTHLKTDQLQFHILMQQVVCEKTVLRKKPAIHACISSSKKWKKH